MKLMEKVILQNPWLQIKTSLSHRIEQNKHLIDRIWRFFGMIKLNRL